MTKNVLSDLNVAFVGAGAMASAMIGGLLARHDVEPDGIIASDRHRERLDAVGGQFGVRTTLDNLAAARQAHVVVLSVKPQVLPAVLAELRGAVEPGALVVSIVAGATIASIATGLGHRGIVRTMPNTPAQVGEGMTVWTATPEVSERQREQAGAIVAALGRQLFVEEEKFLDMATAISGSGPAYVFLMMEALIDAAVHLGFSRDAARELVVQTIRGSAIYAENQPVHPAELRNRVTSPGGTSADALYQLEKGGFRTVMSDAVLAAYERSVALGEMSTKAASAKAASAG
ncbi:MAG: pyrroline-5-carboxylate reductase [Acidobacteria bacterium]|nr:pyrroline-5-carboxylate reductase [Acidobacteriota bacterium]